MQVCVDVCVSEYASLLCEGNYVMSIVGLSSACSFSLRDLWVGY